MMRKLLFFTVMCFLVTSHINGQTLQQHYYEDSKSISLTSLAIDSKGNQYIASTLHEDPGESNSTSDIIISKINKNGQVIWEKQLDYSDHDATTSIKKVDGKDEFVVIGTYQVSNPYEYQLGTVIIKINDNGVVLLEKEIHGPIIQNFPLSFIGLNIEQVQSRFVITGYQTSVPFKQVADGFFMLLDNSFNYIHSKGIRFNGIDEPHELVALTNTTSIGNGRFVITGKMANHNGSRTYTYVGCFDLNGNKLWDKYLMFEYQNEKSVYGFKVLYHNDFVYVFGRSERHESILTVAKIHPLSGNVVSHSMFDVRDEGHVADVEVLNNSNFIISTGDAYDNQDWMKYDLNTNTIDWNYYTNLNSSFQLASVYSAKIPYFKGKVSPFVSGLVELPILYSPLNLEIDLTNNNLCFAFLESYCSSGFFLQRTSLNGMIQDADCSINSFEAQSINYEFSTQNHIYTGVGQGPLPNSIVSNSIHINLEQRLCTEACTGKKENGDNSEIQQLVVVYKNELLNFYSSNLDIMEVNIYSASGLILESISNLSTKNYSFELEFQSGLIIVEIVYENNSKEIKKLIVN